MTEIDRNNTLWKKPVRRATGKKPETEAKAKTTRSKTPAVLTENDVKSHIQQPAPALQAKPTRGGPARPRKVVQESAAEESAEPPARATRGTKASAGKSLTVEPVAHEPDVPAAAQLKTTRRTRATATTTKTLSPKKITQVAKARITRAATQKSASAVGATSKATVTGKAGIRKRKAADENAGVSICSPLESDALDAVVMPSTPAKTVSPRKSPAKISTKAMSEVSMSSRATTPSDSPAPNLEDINDANEYYRSREDDFASEVGSIDELVRANENSEDELCGPKTPMKRTTSSGAEARYRESVKKSIQQRAESPRPQTPVKTTAVSRRPLATPRTQPPRGQPAAQQTNDCAMTAVRIGDKAAALTQEIMRDTPVEQETQLSSVPVEASLLDCDSTGCDDAASETGVEPCVAGLDVGDFEVEDIPTSDAFSSPGSASDIQHEDLNETIIVHDGEEEAPTAVHFRLAGSFDTDDTVLVTQDREEELVDLDTDIEASETDMSAPHAVKPETIIWDNIRQDLTIPLNFEALDFAPTEPPSVDCSVAERDLIDGRRSLASHEDTIVGCEDMEQQEDDESNSDSEDDSNEPANPTINFNDFIDLRSLSEPTRNFQLPVPSTQIVEEVTETIGEAPMRPDDNIESANSRVEVSEPTTKLAHEDPRLEEEEHARQGLAEESDDSTLPHYALPTISFDARRKSLPAITYRTPTKAGTRPSTSDGASAPRIRLMSKWSSSTARSSEAASEAASYAAPIDMKDANVATPQHKRSYPASFAATPAAAPQERYPRMGNRSHYEDHAKTAVQPSRFRTPVQKPARRPATAKKSTADVVTPRASTLRPRAIAISAATLVPLPVTPQTPVSHTTPSTGTPLPTPSERFPRMPPRANYEGHARTPNTPPPYKSTAPSAKSPSKTPPPMPSHTPIRTPLKPPAMTPSQAPMTPHPAAPLRAVVALVEIYTLEGASASTPFIALLRRLGAKTTKIWSESVTHVVFKDGSPTTLQRVRVHNQEVEATGKGKRVHCVNSRWVSDCDAEGQRMGEESEVYVVDVAEVPRAGRRRRKSMEPAALVNLGGNVVRGRKGSGGRGSLGRTSLMCIETPGGKKGVDVMAGITPAVDQADKENARDEASSPVTPAYLAAPETLVQQTAPINRMRKLGSKTEDAAKLRRLTFFNGAARA
ncbi:hypothetical protein LTS16_013589 [Friedmanniomyces endolithicus]|uniref:BRCT domain-containing protein n=1 Tax=Friedmanniomyces endolithicus TaxID=329885 RepID=A0AAN6J0H7_9PEZI|nr:hypothetical protein LTR35_017272 [Friedmanniomyces endolithicus]KAK0269298.1 hypothetical protein LTS00_017321 [Friedmanniomyces endolithicus]KAK0304418.1 hypothetical protein LTR82_017212 [Friedmanniomyces endolithicus]KAK0920562.1 hypothetical protein LTR57_009612 [Friedmanniomyces endolithicus]KAK0974899.1 hypothetical protein LTR54_016947 [Friedmanniomyces endolithicus]